MRRRTYGQPVSAYGCLFGALLIFAVVVALLWLAAR